MPCCLQAASEVDSMQKELTQAKVVVEAATQDCNALLEVITTSTADVETKQSVAIAKEEELKVTEIAVTAASGTKSEHSSEPEQYLVFCQIIQCHSVMLLLACLFACLSVSVPSLPHQEVTVATQCTSWSLLLAKVSQACMTCNRYVDMSCCMFYPEAGTHFCPQT